MLEKLKKLLCRHIFVDRCKIDYYAIKNNSEIVKSYQKICSSRVKNNHCKRHDADGKLLGGYCDYYYQECIKCGKTKEVK